MIWYLLSLVGDNSSGQFTGCYTIPFSRNSIIIPGISAVTATLLCVERIIVIFSATIVDCL